MYRDGHTSYTMRSCCIDPDRAHEQCSLHQENSEVQLRLPEITHHSAITVSVHLHHRQCSLTVLIYITLQHICISGYNNVELHHNKVNHMQHFHGTQHHSFIEFRYRIQFPRLCSLSWRQCHYRSCQRFTDRCQHRNINDSDGHTLLLMMPMHLGRICSYFFPFMYRVGHTFTYNAVMCMYFSIDRGGFSLLLNRSTRDEPGVYKNNIAVIHLVHHDDELQLLNI